MMRISMIGALTSTATAFGAVGVKEERTDQRSFGTLCDGAEYSGVSMLSAVDVAKIWLEATGDDSSCVAAVTVAYGESSEQQGGQGSGCAGGITGPCFPVGAMNPTSAAAGLFQVTPSAAQNPLYATIATCDTADAMTNPCCNAKKAHKIVDYTCIGEAGKSWAGEDIPGAAPFCTGQWTGTEHGTNYYGDNAVNAAAACTAAGVEPGETAWTPEAEEDENEGEMGCCSFWGGVCANGASPWCEASAENCGACGAVWI